MSARSPTRTRRSVLQGVSLLAAARPHDHASRAPVSHDLFRSGLARSSAEPTFFSEFRQLLFDTAHSCIKEDGAWVISGPKYPEPLFCRDSFCNAGALQNRALSGNIIRHFVEDER